MRIMKKMRELLAAIPNNRMLDLMEFKDYCIEYFILPECTIKRCIKQLKFSKLSNEEFNQAWLDLEESKKIEKEVIK